MNYSEIEKLVQGKHLPVAGHNEDEENMIVERGADSAGKFFRLTTCQHNGWLRINTYYENGSSEETYKKGERADLNSGIAVTDLVTPVTVHEMAVEGRYIWHYLFHSTIGDLHVVQHQVKGEMNIVDDYIGWFEEKAKVAYNRMAIRMLRDKE